MTKLDTLRTAPWNVNKEVQIDEDTNIEFPGQEEEVKPVPVAEENEMVRKKVL